MPDSPFTRGAGIASCGFDPVIIPEAELIRIHGYDYRAIVESVVCD